MYVPSGSSSLQIHQISFRKNKINSKIHKFIYSIYISTLLVFNESLLEDELNLLFIDLEIEVRVSGSELIQWNYVVEYLTELGDYEQFGSYRI